MAVLKTRPVQYRDPSGTMIVSREGNDIVIKRRAAGSKPIVPVLRAKAVDILAAIGEALTESTK